ncbi:MAG TPA: protein-ADP-ribose hydrolase [Firmicutes bacterium]|nr:protein-ADP-ribose hydrolase [Bacillota bacterium]
MTQAERRRFLLESLLHERPELSNRSIPADEQEQKALLRSLFNVRTPLPASGEFLAVQDAYLQQETAEKGVTDFHTLRPVRDGLYLWRGDITTLRCDAIVNAANSRMLGCFLPCHGCIDNAIHTFAGIQLRLACAQQMRLQGREEEAGGAKITPGFNLPCRFVLHTVGPIVGARLTKREWAQLASCYRSCLALAEQNGIKSIAFCCISTGEFHFPPDQAAEIAIQTVQEYKEQTHSHIEVIFNVFKQSDERIYRRLLGAEE